MDLREGVVEELLSRGERSTIPGGQHKKDGLQEEGETYPLANPGLAEAPDIDHSTVVPCTGADRSATQSLIDTNHLYNQHQYKDEESRHIDETRHNGAGAKTEAETNTGDYLDGDTHQGNNRNEGVTNLGGDKTKDNGFHQVRLHGASQVNFQPHRGLNKMKRLFTSPTNSLGISHHEVTKVFESKEEGRHREAGQVEDTRDQPPHQGVQQDSTGSLPRTLPRSWPRPSPGSAPGTLPRSLPRTSPRCSSRPLPGSLSRTSSRPGPSPRGSPRASPRYSTRLSLGSSPKTSPRWSRNGTDRNKPLLSGFVDKIRLGLTYSVSKNKEGIGTDKPKFGGLEVKTRIANGVFKNKTEAKGGENKAQFSDSWTRPLPRSSPRTSPRYSSRLSMRSSPRNLPRWSPMSRSNL